MIETTNVPAGIYLHLPFCHSKCTYCGFVTTSYETELVTQYVNALEAEIKHFPPPNVYLSLLSKKTNADTLYIGGGTPSILSAEFINRLLTVCYDTFNFLPNTEITLELNPTDADLERLLAFKNAGINRISLGAQSFFNDQLRALGRDHNADQICSTFNRLRKVGFENISLDLIIGLPNQTLEQWKYNLEKALLLNPDHLSMYMLEVKNGTKLAAQLEANTVVIPDDELTVEMYNLSLEMIEKAGFISYEISNFACSPDRYSQHNLKYWTDVAFYGFGVGAHSYDGEERYWNTSNIHDYITQALETGNTLATRTNRTKHEKFYEALIMGLRLRNGISLSKLQSQYNVNIQAEYSAQIQRLIEAKAIEIEDNVMRLTQSGILISNEVFLEFL